MNSSIGNVELRQLMSDAWAIRATERREEMKSLSPVSVEASGPRLCGAPAEGAPRTCEAAGASKGAPKSSRAEVWPVLSCL